MNNRRRRGILLSRSAILLLVALSLAAGTALGLIFADLIPESAESPSPTPSVSLEVTASESPSATDTPSPTPSATPSSEPTPPETPTLPPEDIPAVKLTEDEERAAAYVATMTLREKICQMMIVTPDALTGVSGVTSAGPVTKASIEKYPVGGLIHFGANITSADQITLFNTNAQSYAKTPMFIAVDEEGGRVARLKSKLGAHSVDAMLTYENDGTDKATENAKTIAAALKQYGFNTDFAPVADVWSNPNNTAVGDRAYSTDFDLAAELVSAAVIGFNESNVVCSLKHFPGHGDTREDSHNGSAYVNKTLAELRQGEFIPFASGIAAGADMVMMGHLIVPEADSMPASLSHTIITDVLREELGFEGVVITDSLAMNAVSSKYSTKTVAVTAVKAGVDILLMPQGIETTITALTEAVENGEISESRIDQSVTRILTLKSARGIW